jgi:methyl-accepting chemotaxis protein
MATGIASLEQRVMKLQGTLQSSLNDLNTLLDAKSQRQNQFEETVRQDVQSLGDSLAQLRDAQTGLQKRIQEMQSSSESQTEDLLSAIEQLQQKTDSNSALVPAEIKSSKAQPEQIPLP